MSKDFLKLEKDIDKLMKQAEKNIFKGYKNSLDHLKKEMAMLYEKYSIDGKLTENAMNKYNRIVALDKDIQLTVKMLYEANVKEINSTLTNTFLHTSKSIISIVDKEVGERLKPITKAMDVNKTINANMKGLNYKDRLNHHRNNLIYDVQKTVKEGISSGDTYKTMAERLSKSLNGDINKATQIARTETTRVKSQAQKDTLDELYAAGVAMTKVWNNVLDERSRETHVSMDGTSIEYGEDFVTPAGNSGFGPHLLNDNGEDSIRCRCYLTIIFD